MAGPSPLPKVNSSGGVPSWHWGFRGFGLLHSAMCAMPKKNAPFSEPGTFAQRHRHAISRMSPR